MANTVRMTRRWPDGDSVQVTITADAAYPDALDQARATATRAFADALDVTLTYDDDANDAAVDEA